MKNMISTLTLASFAAASAALFLPAVDAQAASKKITRCVINGIPMTGSSCEQVKKKRPQIRQRPAGDRQPSRRFNFTSDPEYGLERIGGGAGGDGGGGGGGGNAGGRSDIRLKRDIVEVGSLPNGLKLYRFKYLWSDTEWVGVMAQEVLKVAPHAVITGSDGFYRVRYDLLGTSMMTFDEWQAQAAANHHPPLAA